MKVNYFPHCFVYGFIEMMFLFTCNKRPDIGNNALSSFVTMECNSCINNELLNYVVMWELLDKCFSI